MRAGELAGRPPTADLPDPTSPSRSTAAASIRRPGTGALEPSAAFLAAPDPVGLYAEPAHGRTGRRGPARRPASARRLRLVSLLVLGLTLTGLGVADYLGVAIPLAVYCGCRPARRGADPVVATWLGRARGLLPLGWCSCRRA